MKIPAKTRLGKEMGDETKARKVGHQLTIETLEKFSSLPNTKKYFCYGGEEFLEQSEINRLKVQYSQYEFFSQAKEKDVLGIKDAFDEIFEKKTATQSKILLIGTDIIGLDENILKDCFDELEYFDTAIVPVEDNGYGLVGLSKNIDVFSDIKNWESHSKGYDLVKETQKLCTTKNISVFIHPITCFDIDTKQDYERWKSN